MEKKLTYEEYVRIKNLLVKIKNQVGFIDQTRIDVNKSVEEINEILND